MNQTKTELVSSSQLRRLTPTSEREPKREEEGGKEGEEGASLYRHSKVYEDQREVTFCKFHALKCPLCYGTVSSDQKLFDCRAESPKPNRLESS